jgi:uncharacterized membrane protein
MTTEPTQRVVIAGFDSAEAAASAYVQLKEIEKSHAIEMKDAAILEMDANAKLHIRDVEDMTGARGAVIGGTVGAVVGAITGPVGWVTLGGAAVGGLVAKLRDSGFDQRRLEQFGANLQPGTSALVTRTDEQYAGDIEDTLKMAARNVLTLEIGPNLANELESVHL